MKGVSDQTKRVLTYPLFFFCAIALSAYMPITYLASIRVAQLFHVDNFIETTILSMAISHTTVSVLFPIFGAMKYGHYIFLFSLGFNAIVFSMLMLLIAFASEATGKYLYIVLISTAAVAYALGITSGLPIAMKIYGPNGSSFNFGVYVAITITSYVFEVVEQNFDLDDNEVAMNVLLIFHSYPIGLILILLPIVAYLTYAKFIEPNPTSAAGGITTAINGLKKAYPATIILCSSMFIEIFYIPAIIPYSLGLETVDSIKVIKFNSASILCASFISLLLSSTAFQFAENNEPTKYKYGLGKKRFYFMLFILVLTRLVLLTPTLFFDKDEDISILSNYLKAIILYSGFVQGICLGQGFDGIFPLNLNGLVPGGSGKDSFDDGIRNAAKAAEVTAIMFSSFITLASAGTKLYFVCK